MALYARVSSERQERDETVQSQLEALRAHADAQGYAAPAEYVDEGRSGYDLNRPSLDRLRDAVTAGGVDVVLVHEIGRLARDHADQAVLLRELRKHARVEFVKHPTDDSAEGQLLENMLGAIANFEGRVIADRTRRGRQHWVEQGALVASGVPYGYRFVPRTADHRATMEVDEAQATVVREIFAMLVDERMACRAICRRLTERGTPAPKGGRIWHPSVLQRILTNTAYVGRFVYGKNEAAEPQRAFKPVGERARRKSSRKALPPEQWVTIPCQSIVDEATFGAAQAQLAANSRFSPRHNTRNEYLLRGLIRCGRCGGAYVGKVVSRRGGGRQRYYYCRSADPYNTGSHGPCRGGYVNADMVERTVWETVVELLRPEVLAAEYRRRASEEDAGGHEAEARKVQDQLRKVGREEKRWKDAYGAEVITLPELKEKIAVCKARRQALEGRVSELAAGQERRRHETEVLASLEAFCRRIGEGIDTLDFAGRQQVLRTLVEAVIIEPDEGGTRIVVKTVVPLGPQPTGGPGDIASDTYPLRSDRLGPEQGHHLPGRDAQINAVEGPDLPEALGDGIECDRGCRHVIASPVANGTQRRRRPAPPEVTGLVSWS